MDASLVEIKDEHFVVDLMYAGTHHNMTGVAVYQEIGLGNHAYVHQDLWARLRLLIPYLEKTSQKLKIYDAFRPLSAHKRLFSIINRDGFFIADATQSPHCRGTAVDVAIIGADGKELVYPTLVDAYDKDYAQEVQSGNFDEFFKYLKKASLDYEDLGMRDAIKNRNKLYNLMTGIGLVPPPRRHEWWHYELKDGRSAKYPPLDI